MIEDFESWLRRDGKAERTIESYTADARDFEQWLEESREQALQDGFSRRDVTDYRSEIVERLSVSTVNKRVNSLKSLNEFMIERGIMGEMAVITSQDRISIARGSSNGVEVFSREDIDELLEYLKSDDSAVSHRDRMIVHLLLYTGLRVTEMVNLKLDDVDLLAGELEVVGKNQTYRGIPLNSRVKRSIRDYLQHERSRHRLADKSEHLILTERSPKAHRDAINKMLKNIEEDLGFEIYPHKFRHTMCTMLLKNGTDIATVADIAGHRSIETTHKFYLSTSTEEKRQALESL